MSTFIKDPDATLDYFIDWSRWLDGDTISTSEWTVVDSGIELVSGSDSHADGVTTVFVTGGAANSSYRIRNRIVTGDGLTDDRTITIKIKSK